MPQTGFIAALAAEITFGAYETPCAVDHKANEWIIVSVWGANREFVTLSYTQSAVEGDTAPPNLQPKSTHLGILLSRVLNDKDDVSEYLLMRNRPPDIPVGGTFHPTDGFIRIVQAGHDISLTAHGRFAHAVGRLHGRRVVHDVPDPPPGAAQARGWHMSAVRRGWIGEYFSAADSIVLAGAAPSGKGAAFLAADTMAALVPSAHASAHNVAASASSRPRAPAVARAPREMPVLKPPPSRKARPRTEHPAHRRVKEPAEDH